MRDRLKDRERAAVLGFTAKVGGLVLALSGVLGLAGWFFWSKGLPGLVAGLVVTGLAFAGLPALPLDAPPSDE